MGMFDTFNLVSPIKCPICNVEPIASFQTKDLGGYLKDYYFPGYVWTKDISIHTNDSLYTINVCYFCKSCNLLWEGTLSLLKIVGNSDLCLTHDLKLKLPVSNHYSCSISPASLLHKAKELLQSGISWNKVFLKLHLSRYHRSLYSRLAKHILSFNLSDDYLTIPYDTQSTIQYFQQRSLYLKQQSKLYENALFNIQHPKISTDTFKTRLLKMDAQAQAHDPFPGNVPLALDIWTFNNDLRHLEHLRRLLRLCLAELSEFDQQHSFLIVNTIKSDEAKFSGFTGVCFDLGDVLSHNQPIQVTKFPITMLEHLIMNMEFEYSQILGMLCHVKSILSSQAFQGTTTLDSLSYNLSSVKDNALYEINQLNPHLDTSALRTIVFSLKLLNNLKDLNNEPEK